VTGLNLRGGTLFSGSTLGRRAIVDAPLRNFGPRLGVAYQATPSIVIRSAYGIYYTAPPFSASRHNLGEGFATQTPWVASLDGATPIATLSTPFPAGVHHIQGSG